MAKSKNDEIRDAVRENHVQSSGAMECGLRLFTCNSDDQTTD